jgi:hypothetical protein
MYYTFNIYLTKNNLIHIKHILHLKSILHLLHMTNQKPSKFFSPQNNTGLSSVKIDELKPVIENTIIKETKVELPEQFIEHNEKEEVKKQPKSSIKELPTVRVSVILSENLNFDLEGCAHSLFKTKQEIVIEALEEYFNTKEFKRLPNGLRISNAGRKKK